MNNEVVIEVRADNNATKTFRQVEVEADRVGKSAGDKLSTGISGKFIALAGKLTGKITEAVSGIGGKVSDGLGKAISSLPPMGQLLAPVLAAGLAVAMAPLVGAAISAAVTLGLGGGVLGLGILAATKDKKVDEAFGNLKTKAQKVFEDFGTPFEKPLIRAAKTFGKVLDDLKPSIKRLGEIIAPVIDRLAPALGGILKSMMPGIEQAVKASVPLFNTLAEKLPGIGKAIGTFFSSISENSGDTTTFFGDLLDLIAGLIIVLGKIIGKIASFYNEWRIAIEKTTKAITGFGRTVLNIFGSIVNGAADAFSWVPGIGPKLRTAANKFNDFKKDANRYLDQIDKDVSVEVKIRMRVFGQAAATAALETARILSRYKASGGVVGTAASGGVRNNLTWVGEEGPELVDLPPGTTVHSAGDSQRKMQQASAVGSAQPTDVNLRITFANVLGGLREEIRIRGGNVQQVLGS